MANVVRAFVEEMLPVWLARRSAQKAARAKVIKPAADAISPPKRKPTGIAMITSDMVPAGPASRELLPTEIIRTLIRLSSIARVELDLLPHRRGFVVRRMTNEGDVVFGVWQDTREPTGFAVLRVKGEHLLP